MNAKFNWSRWVAGLGLAGAMAAGAVSMHAGDAGTVDSKQAGPAPVSAAAAEQAVASAKGLSTAFRVAADRVLPSVVMIETKVTSQSASSEQPLAQQNPLEGKNPFEGTPFEDLFRNGPMGRVFSLSRFHSRIQLASESVPVSSSTPRG